MKEFKVAVMFMGKEKSKKFLERKKFIVMNADPYKNFTIFTVRDPLNRDDPDISRRVTAMNDELVYIL